MGIRLFGSSSSYDRPSERIVEKTVYKSPNPNPKNCKVTHIYELGKYTVVGITYPDCTTFEGKKILVYEDCSLERLNRQMQIVGIDPHFSANKMYYSPIARFIPTKKGWQMAKDFVKMLWDLECKAPRYLDKYNNYKENV